MSSILQVIVGRDVHAALEAEKVKAVGRSTIAGREEFFDSEALSRFQQIAASEGYLEAELVKSIHGWGLRYASAVHNFGIIARSHDIGADGSWEAAVAYAEKWQAHDPARRYVTCSDPKRLALAPAKRLQPGVP